MNSNHEYRQYLMNNAKEIMHLNKIYQQNQTCLLPTNINIHNNVNFIYNSDLKQTQLNRINKLKIFNTPLL